MHVYSCNEGFGGNLKKGRSGYGHVLENSDMKSCTCVCTHDKLYQCMC